MESPSIHEISEIVWRVEVDTPDALRLRSRHGPRPEVECKTVLVKWHAGNMLIDHHNYVTLFYAYPSDMYSSFPDPDGPTRRAVSEVARSCVKAVAIPGSFGSFPCSALVEGVYHIVFTQSDRLLERDVLESVVQATKKDTLGLTAGLFVGTRDYPGLCPLAGEVADDLRDVLTRGKNLYGTVVLSPQCN